MSFLTFCRRLIWEKNVRLVEKHNLEADRGLHTYTLGINEYADMVSRETQPGGRSWSTHIHTGYQRIR